MCKPLPPTLALCSHTVIITTESYYFDPVEDAIAYGRDVIPLVKKEVQRKEQQTVTVA
ncbi:hypothetical protein [Nostoc commune]|uniref:hypothetical protein n=1 Tax=Nostoc commune TaxID=1178 RepID=UPI001C62E524|nr:hypothetical protein [Nostoc commune]